mgnify:CR=1 FL=1
MGVTDRVRRKQSQTFDVDSIHGRAFTVANNAGFCRRIRRMHPAVGVDDLRGFASPTSTE